MPYVTLLCQHSKCNLSLNGFLWLADGDHIYAAFSYHHNKVLEIFEISISPCLIVLDVLSLNNVLLSLTWKSFHFDVLHFTWTFTAREPAVQCQLEVTPPHLIEVIRMLRSKWSNMA